MEGFNVAGSSVANKASADLYYFYELSDDGTWSPTKITVTQLSPQELDLIRMESTCSPGRSGSEICGICHAEIDINNRDVVKLRCNHDYHEGCLNQWNTSGVSKVMTMDGQEAAVNPDNLYYKKNVYLDRKTCPYCRNMYADWYVVRIPVWDGDSYTYKIKIDELKHSVPYIGCSIIFNFDRFEKSDIALSLIIKGCPYLTAQSNTTKASMQHSYRHSLIMEDSVLGYLKDCDQEVTAGVKIEEAVSLYGMCIIYKNITGAIGNDHLEFFGCGGGPLISFDYLLPFQDVLDCVINFDCPESDSFMNDYMKKLKGRARFLKSEFFAKEDQEEELKISAVSHPSTSLRWGSSVSGHGKNNAAGKTSEGMLNYLQEDFMKTGSACKEKGLSVNIDEINPDLVPDHLKPGGKRKIGTAQKMRAKESSGPVDDKSGSSSVSPSCGASPIEKSRIDASDGSYTFDVKRAEPSDDMQPSGSTRLKNTNTPFPEKNEKLPKTHGVEDENASLAGSSTAKTTGIKVGANLSRDKKWNDLVRFEISVTNEDNTVIYARLDNIMFKKENPSFLFNDAYRMDHLSQKTMEYKRFKNDFSKSIKKLTSEQYIYIKIRAMLD